MLVYFLLLFFLCVFYIIEVLHISSFSFCFCPSLNIVLWALPPHHCKSPPCSQLYHLLSARDIPYLQQPTFYLYHTALSKGLSWRQDTRDCPQLAAEELSPTEVQWLAPACMPGHQNQDQNPGLSPPIPGPYTIPQEIQKAHKENANTPWSENSGNHV